MAVRLIYYLSCFSLYGIQSTKYEGRKDSFVGDEESIFNISGTIYAMDRVLLCHNL